MMIRNLAVTIAAVLAATTALAQETITRGKNISADIANDGRLAIGLAGDIWIVPASGGEAVAVTRDLKSARTPRWSPDASKIAYQAISGNKEGIWIHDLDTSTSQTASSGASFDIHPAWHPGAERLIYASDATGSGFDLWEVDLPTGIRWRLSDRPGDETAPAWSADGRDLVYVHHVEDTWTLILRRHGQPEETLVSTQDRLAAPSWRPDGSLITYFKEGAAATSLNMVILSQPRLLRPYTNAENFVLAPVSWLDRHRMIYTADGAIRQRLFNSWSSSQLPFRATIRKQTSAVAAVIERRQLPSIDEPPGGLVIHASRMWDGLDASYQGDRDIIIDGGRITAVEPHRERPGSIIINMGDLTVIPGLVDAHSRLSANTGESFGALLLTTGVSTLVTEHVDTERLDEVWSGKASPGPRLLRAENGTDEQTTAIADSMTPGLSALLQTRQALLIGMPAPVARRFVEPTSIDSGVTSVVIGSRDNGLQPGIALHAELRALTAAGLKPAQALRAAGVNAAAMLGLDPFLGRIAVGAVADLVFVDGDPLNHIEDAVNVVAIVRNGRFFSVVGLMERVESANSVE